MFLVPPERWPRRALRVSMGAEPLCICWVVFLSERSLFFLPGEAFFTPTGKLLSASGQENCCACTMTYSGREEERAPSIYRAGSGDAQRRCRGCAVPKLS